MPDHTPYIVNMTTWGVPGTSTFYGPFDGAAQAFSWAEHSFPTTTEKGRQWYVTRLTNPESKHHEVV